MKYKNKLMKVLRDLRNSGRFIPLQVVEEANEVCEEITCQICVSITRSELAEAKIIGGERSYILARSNCSKCFSNNIGVNSYSEVIDTDHYLLNELFYESLGFHDIFIRSDPQEERWDRDRFEKKVLIPLFTYTKKLKIYDRNIGRYWSDNEGYKKTIEWMLKVFRERNRFGQQGVFEVYTGLGRLKKDGKLKPDQEKNLRGLKKFDREYKVPIIIKKETYRQEFPHDRFLVTDQIAISIGRGFDLLNPDESSPDQIRCTYISVCSNPGDITDAVEGLNNYIPHRPLSVLS